MRSVVRPFFVCVAALCVGLHAQTQTTPVPRTPPAIVPEPETPEQIEIKRMQQEYLTGNAEAAVAYFAHRPPEDPPSKPENAADLTGSYAAGLVHTLLTTEAAMQRRTFGKYANYAPLETRLDVVELNGAFDLESFTLYRNLDDTLHLVRNEVLPRDRNLRPPVQPNPPVDKPKAPVPAAQRALVERFDREWHVITISYCLRWQLNCARNLLASAKERFPNAADVLVIEAATAEQKEQLGLAESLLRRAIASEPNNIAARLRLGRALLARGQTTEAQTMLDSALTAATAAHHDASRYFALESLSDLDRRAGRATRARDRFVQAMKITPFSSPPFEGLTPQKIYSFGLFYEQPRRLAALRQSLRSQITRSSTTR